MLHIDTIYLLSCYSGFYICFPNVLLLYVLLFFYCCISNKNPLILAPEEPVGDGEGHNYVFVLVVFSLLFLFCDLIYCIHVVLICDIVWTELSVENAF